MNNGDWRTRTSNIKSKFGSNIERTPLPIIALDRHESQLQFGNERKNADPHFALKMYSYRWHRINPTKEIYDFVEPVRHALMINRFGYGSCFRCLFTVRGSAKTKKWNTCGWPSEDHNRNIMIWCKRFAFWKAFASSECISFELIIDFISIENTPIGEFAFCARHRFRCCWPIESKFNKNNINSNQIRSFTVLGGWEHVRVRSQLQTQHCCSLSLPPMLITQLRNAPHELESQTVKVPVNHPKAKVENN